ncbi:Protein HVA22 [Ananas comosus]|uniref:HVA22-like protein n=1 Tax=Ananas comosus TaxID=4615 RepID=A0A199VDL4_ANACO|nr:Protein HVA22 [Ananas comosus]
MGQLWTILTHLHSLAGPTVMLLYPLYASIQAMETPTKLDDEQWLAYWILYSFLTLSEMVLESVIYWIPIWYELKLVFVAWLVLPQFRGAAFIYDKFVREQLRKQWSTKDVAKPSSPPSSSPSKDKDSSIKKKFVSFITPKKGGHEAY